MLQELHCDTYQHIVCELLLLKETRKGLYQGSVEAQTQTSQFLCVCNSGKCAVLLCVIV
jgi:hypothetical protein